MKLDKDLVRSILLAVEDKDGDPSLPVILNIDGYDHTTVAHHVRLLSDAGFLVAIDFSSFDAYDWQPRYLTYSGHEFLDTIRDGEIWKLTKESAQKVGGASLGAIFEIGKGFVKQKLIEHGVHIA